MDHKHEEERLPEEEVVSAEVENICNEPEEDTCAVCSEMSDEAEKTAEPQEEQAAAPAKKNIWQVVLTAGICLILLLVMALVVISGAGKTKDGMRPVNAIADVLCVFRKDDIHCRSTFACKESKAQKKANDVIATIGKYELTNGQLQIFYWMQISNFRSTYGNSLFDADQPLAAQYYSEEENLSWEQYFLDNAIKSWSRYVMLNILAEQEGLPMSNEEYLTVLNESVETEAEQYGFENAEAMVKEYYGAACTKADYVNYICLYEIALSYFEGQYETFVPTDEQISAYYDENKTVFEANGLKKEDKKLVDVRHILVRLDDVELNAYGQVDYTEEQWEQCRQKAQQILDTYLENPTEENFGELAKEHSEDGSASVGGLYQDVTEGQMVEAFNNWIFSEDRKAADTGLVKTKFGYHVMYFVGSEVIPGDWYEIAKTQLASDHVNGLIETAESNNPVTVSYKKIAIAQKATEQAPAQ